MLKIRFQRTGRKKTPFFRVVVAEHSKPVTGRFVEILGYYNPQTKETSLKEDRIKHWISVGAQPTDRVARLASKNGISECEKFIEERKLKPSNAEVEAEKAKKEAEEKAKQEAEEKAQKEAEEKAQAKKAEEEKAAETPAEETAEAKDAEEASAEKTEEEKKE